jgi:hypothetical protein
MLHAFKLNHQALEPITKFLKALHPVGLHHHWSIIFPVPPIRLTDRDDNRPKTLPQAQLVVANSKESSFQPEKLTEKVNCVDGVSLFVRHGCAPDVLAWIFMTTGWATLTPEDVLVLKDRE